MSTARAWAYRALVFLSSWLLFTIELIAAKLLLPRFGSSASVWSTSLVFFQGALLLGYLLAARVTKVAGWRWRHLLVVGIPLATLPVHLPQLTLPPVLAVTVLLAVAVGLPFIALSTTSVVAQRWLHDSGLERAKDPAFLYGLSNGGALLALISYPLVVEPALALHEQLWVWYGAYGVFVVLHLLCVPPKATVQTSDVVRGDAPTPAPSGHPLPGGEGSAWWAWLLLPAAGNALLMAATNALAGDASVPLLWVLPLSVYLVTLILCFAPWPLHPRLQDALSLGALATAVAGMLLMRARTHYELGAVLTHDAFLLVGCLLVHAAVSRLRPSSPGERGRYFFAQSLGGFLGSSVVGLLLPAFGAPFAYYDYLAAGTLLLLAFAARDRLRLKSWLAKSRLNPVLASLGALGLAALLVLAARAGTAASLDATRTFYGLYRVYDDGPLRYFRHGATTHGVEDLARPGEPLSYYHRGSPAGRVLATDLPRHDVGLVGLGVGSLASYARDGERWTVYELDPEVERLARKDFTFLSRAHGDVRVVTGDARQSLLQVPDQSFDLLVLDAFSSDFVPLHLLSREAVQLYLAKLKPHGMLLVHVSSRILDLVPVLTRLAADAGAAGVYAQGDDGELRGAFASVWFALATDASRLDPLVGTLGFKRLELTPELAARRPWSDDYVNLFHALRR